MSSKVAIVGATGAVGQAFLQCMEKRNFPVSELTLFASKRSLGKVLHFNNKPLRIRELTTESAKENFDVVLMSAGKGISKEYAPLFAKSGAVVVDNSSCWRMDPEVPLVVPEVNPDDILKHKGIIANPNCSTITMVLPLKAIHDVARVKRVIVSTYQATSGAGAKGRLELEDETRSLVLDDRIYERKVFPRQIAFNAIPHIDFWHDDGYTNEEKKMMSETQKIMGDDSIKVAATCVRIAVKNGHSESINVETERPLTVAQAIDAFKRAEGVIVSEKAEDYPTAAETSGREEVFVGRVRLDPTVENGLAFWSVGDNLLKGAALNAVQIAERLVK